MITDLQQRSPNASEHDDGVDAIQVGQWYWMDRSDDDDERWLGCVVHVGSNYAKLEGVHASGNWRHSERIGFDGWDARCTRCADAEAVLRQQAAACQNRIQKLTAEVSALTMRLGVADIPQLGEGGQTAALALRTGEPLPSYRTALVQAKEETLPSLFREIRDVSERMARWMEAEAIPLRAGQIELKDLCSAIDHRILGVDLYAGLSEQAVAIREGDPAPLGEPVRLMQRRHYMDEECLANYHAGGMEFADLPAFDRWLAADENRARILPFPRCVVAFQVRRQYKERHGSSLAEWIHIVNLEKADRFTFLYVRNGEQVWRVATAIDFGELLFPDSARQLTNSDRKIWAKMSFNGTKVEGFLSDEERRAIRADHARELREWRTKMKAWEAAQDRGDESASYFAPHKPRFNEDHRPFVPDDLYYDDMVARLAAEIAEHNRLVLVLHGLLDRSPVLLPHPPWRIWTPAGFRAAIQLVFDADRALVAGPPPDFRAYQRRLNASLAVGSLTVGQRRAWRNNEKKPRSYRDEGPPQIARVAAYQPRKRVCAYEWLRDRAWTPDNEWKWRGRPEQLVTRFRCSADAVLNLDAYTPGDMRQFYADPRTRADYLQWAPLLLAAEDYCAHRAREENADER